ncbi:MAG: MBL fold metallo-hydrolase [Mesorhizobium sp.]|uniref:MBL fold metallo-hydrolase n=1 Tax=Mesorhizobium sp. TaxID=1871066 RepID=UPI000FE61DE0|nr:MBL fold metallo-hydrolase [Mesorhizobium sp.]RWH79263.1 MAG: MBL fold metallo-hydrolase [Mesorhizobium sp.]RWH81791.1 MAG: MBL fold metallo-hydrolase [Mesorhizobium sp.]RWH88057.1 MAG: MBL fold metallo-hydrolase [Mesorhizobium sp.]RWI01619.1 MAG: MBL fold metallo-hydrolase [Mesorhizobium sp.]RWI02066.1 MAG: MBL fold metallo-hydrolase [Mesorhizobium sp.]
MSADPTRDRLVLLGSKGGPALRPGGPWPSSSLLEIGGRTIVVDCGLGVTRGLADAGISLKALDLVFITHLHSDHVLELGPLIHTAWTAGLATPVTVFGPPGTGHYWRRFCQAMEFDIEIRIIDEGRPDIRDLVSIIEFGEGRVMEERGLKVSALRVDHPPVTDCFALRFEHAGRSVVFSADTAFFPPLADFAKGADILVHEAMLEEGIERLVAKTGNGARLREHLLASHTFAEEAGRIASDAGVKRLVLNHLIPADDPEIGEADWIAAVRKTWAGDLTIARDSLVVGLEDDPEPKDRVSEKWEPVFGRDHA